MKKQNVKRLYIHYVPTTDAGSSIWTGNFKEKISIVGPLLGQTPANISALETAADNYRSAVQLVEIKRKELEEAVAAKNQSKAIDLQALIDAAAVMKRHADYQDSLGSALGIVGTQVQYDEKDLKPIITARVLPGRVEVGFNLQLMNSISIYSRIKGTMGWVKLGNDYASPFEDRRPLAVEHQPEIREYQAFYFNGKEDVGQPSDIVTAVFAG